MNPAIMLLMRGNAISIVIASDTFTRADGPLGTTEVGGKAWTTTGGAWAVAGNMAKQTAFTSRSSATIDTGSTSHAIAATVTRTGGLSQYPFLVAGFVDTANTYQFVSDGLVGTLTLSRRIGGTNTVLRSVSGYAHQNSMKLRVQQVSGSVTRVTAWVGETLFHAVDDSTAGRPVGTGAGIALPNADYLSSFDDVVITTS